MGEPQSGVGSPAAFDKLAGQLERGELAPATHAETSRVLAQLEKLVPPGDARRELRYRYTYCIFAMDEQPAKGVAYAEQGIKDAQRIGYPSAEANFHYCRGEHQEALTTPADALADYSAGIEIARRAENMRLVADGLSWRGNVQSLLGEPALALVDFLQAQRNYQDAGETVQSELNLLNIATAYRRIGELDQARRYIEQSLADAGKRHDVLQRISAEEQFGFLDSDSAHWASAHRHFTAALTLARGIGDHEGLGSAYLGQAGAFNQEGRHAQALDALGLAQAEFDQAADRSNRGMLALQKAEAEAGLGRHALALADYDQAEQLLRAGGNLRYMAELLDARARSYEALGKPAKAVLDLRRTIRVREALDRNARRYDTTLMSYQFDTERRDQEARRLSQVSALQARQLAALKHARHWQNLAMLTGSALLLGLLALAVRQVRHSRRLQRLAMTDALTGIANRRGIEEMARRAMRGAGLGGEPMAVLVLDIDHFKRINDSHGHQVGDMVLVRLVQVWQKTLRSSDHLGRVGGEEFLAILPQTDLEAGRLIAERLRADVGAMHLSDIAPGLAVSISLGVAQLRSPAESVQSLLERADQALYRAKAAGRNRVELAA